MRSFIPWIGGKTLLAKQVTAEFPNKIGRYIEVFGGGGAILFSSDKHSPMEVYNDANSNLVNLFRCIKYHPEELRKEVLYYLNSREMFYDIQKRLDCPGFTDIQRAAMFYVAVKTSFGADTNSFGCSVKSLNTDIFDKISERLKRVVVEHKDFEMLIKQYDRTDALFYCDPPYHTTEKHYSEKFTEDDHYRLNTVLKSLKGRFVLSYNDDNFIRELYKEYLIISVERQNNLSNGKFREVIIKNY